MPIVLSVSSILLVVVIMFRHIELVKGNRRMFELSRRRLDRTTFKVLSTLKRRVKSAIEFVHKDVFLYAIHLVMYIALMVVRIVENRLDKVTSFIRSFRKRTKKRSTSEKLRGIARENRTVEENEQNL